VVSPGPVRTPLWTAPGGLASVLDGPGMTTDQVMDELLPSAMSITTGRVSEAAEVAALVAYLASPTRRTSPARTSSSTAA